MITLHRWEVWWDLFEEFLRPWLVDFIRVPAEDFVSIDWDLLISKLFESLKSNAYDWDSPTEKVKIPSYNLPSIDEDDDTCKFEDHLM